MCHSETRKKLIKIIIQRQLRNGIPYATFSVYSNQEEGEREKDIKSDTSRITICHFTLSQSVICVRNQAKKKLENKINK